MDFFAHQGRARRRTYGLAALFVLALVCIVLLVDLVVLVFFGSYQGLNDPMPGLQSADAGPPGLYAQHLAPNLPLLFWVSAATAGGILLASQIRVLTLRGGGGVVARSLGGTLVDAETQDPLRRRLRNVVEEMAIAAGVPVPEIYVLEQELGINAFAAGYSPADAAIAVTQGTLMQLDRAELQGVVAHELGHILNGDMRLNIRLMGVLFGISVLALLGRLLLNTRQLSSRREGLGLAALGVALFLIGWIGLLFGRLIKASVSRQREFLADASAVQFTRQPSGIAGALKKIAATSTGSALHADAEEIAHMLFASGFARQWLATHPPLAERIRAIEPRFDPRELDAIAARMRAGGAGEAGTATAPALPGQHLHAPAAEQPPARLDADRIIARMGQPLPAQVAAAERRVAALPQTLARAAHALGWVDAVVCYLLILPDAEIRDRQLLLITSAAGAEVERQVRHLLSDVPTLDPELRLPLLEILFPVLRRRPTSALLALRDLAERLIEVDGHVALFEYVLARLLAGLIRDMLQPASASHAGRRKLAEQTPAAIDLLTILARHGRDTWPDARRALAAGLQRLGARPEVVAQIERDWSEPTWLADAWQARLDQALATLIDLRVEDQRRLIGGLVATILEDGRAATAELELLRLVCATLRMPVPLLELSGGTGQRVPQP